MMPLYSQSNMGYKDFKNAIASSDFMKGIDKQPTLTDGKAYDLDKTVWNEVLATTKSKEEALFSFVEYLDLVKSHVKGFMYKIADEHRSGVLPWDDTAASVCSGPLLGVMWMMANMHCNLELFGLYICLDMMMRGLNKLL